MKRLLPCILIVVYCLTACMALPAYTPVETAAAQSSPTAAPTLMPTIGPETPSPTPSSTLTQEIIITPSLSPTSTEFITESPIPSPTPSIEPIPTSVVIPLSQPTDIDPSKPMIALTFDDGPGKGTEVILDTLALTGGRVTFCVLGENANRYPDLIRRGAEMGCEYVNHSWNHPRLTELSSPALHEQMAQTNALITSLTGQEVRFIRPPYGSYNPAVQDMARLQGMALLTWSIDTRDWESRDVQAIYDLTMAQAKDGAILLFHDIHETTAEAIMFIMPELAKKGYQFVTVSELLSFSEREVLTGEVYKRR